MTQRFETKVLIIGAGMAGLCAAVTALENGATVMVLEKGNRYGGSMALSNGLIWTFAQAADALLHVPEGDAASQELLVENFPADLAWLSGLGVQLEPEIRFLQYGRGQRSAPSQMMDVLLDRITALGGTVLPSTAMHELTTQNGKVDGAIAFRNGEMLEIRAQAVILATGGFQGNPEMVARYITPNADSLYLRSNPWSTGDGILAAQKMGAAMTPCLHTFYGHAMSAPPTRFNRLQFQEMSHKYGQLAVALNLDGHRFADESAGTGEELLNAHIAQQPKATAVYLFDAQIAEHCLEGTTLARVVVERTKNAGGPVIQEDSLEKLAAAMTAWGLPSAQVLETLSAYNEAARARHAEGIVPARRKHLHPLASAPFTAVLVRASITFTGGGLYSDLSMRVQRRSSSVSTMRLVTADASELSIAAIPGLFAAGCDVGGFNAEGYVGGLAQALVTGRVAGLGASESCK